MSNRDDYLGEQLTHAVLQRRQRDASDRHRRAMDQVSDFLDTQQEMGDELSTGLVVLRRQRGELDTMQQTEGDTSILASLVRPFTARRSALARRSIAEGLLRQHQRISVRLAEATAFSDELKLSALELQQEVDRLHRELGEALHNQRVAAQRVLDAERALAEIDSDLSPEQTARLRDRYEFDARTEAVSLELYRSAAELCRQHLPTARSLRDTVLKLHEEMAKTVLAAQHTVNSAGRQIQGLGLLADTPTVVRELQESLDQLNGAMAATQDYVRRSTAFLSQELPHISALIRAESEASELALEAELTQLDRQRAIRDAEAALREAAQEEIESLLDPAGKYLRAPDAGPE